MAANGLYPPAVSTLVAGALGTKALEEKAMSGLLSENQTQLIWLGLVDQ